jgi:16S rRNA U516 pseudouridylate synthase RsuA-like enzyme
MPDPIRLSKRLIEQLSCSRREAELYIQGGWVLVDGQVVEEPQFKVLEQKVELHPDATLTPLAPATLCESVGLTLVGMKRIRIGALSMGKLPAGQGRYMAPHEKF